MSGIRVNEWLHNSGTGGIWQTSAGNVGIASSVPTTKLEVTGDAKISGVSTATAFIPSAGQLSHRNLIINGAMQVAQYGTSSTNVGYKTVDRITSASSGLDESPTYAQVDVASGTTPYTLGFRKAFSITNGNQTGGAGAADYIELMYKLEAQDLAKSGWNYVSSSSYVTLSFWCKSSVAQNFYFFLKTSDGTAKQYPFETGSLTAGAWTKVTKTIPGHSDLTFTNDTGEGIRIDMPVFYGTDKTHSGATLNAWANYNGAGRTPDNTSTWYTTNDSTFQITGLQLEVGSVATPFEHRSYADELRRCQRYFWKVDDGNYRRINGYKRHDNNCHWEMQCPVPMRVAPSPTLSDGGMFTNFQSTYTATQSSPTIGEWNLATGQGLFQVQSTWSSTHANIPSWESYALEMSAEL